ncbi:hypothetical protein LX32DRAFT_634920 [Colletotrichum zoysiae]|uniref:Uncharacterized protein n=1 Tax=Colletotrichum zoysiae TaxID=1216348 RepID=A0AAD9HS45_9PEZI|nr:hypothetical protein LX32DRAFT_634920 [Colletotrichum zoysiae]
MKGGRRGHSPSGPTIYSLMQPAEWPMQGPATKPRGGQLGDMKIFQDSIIIGIGVIRASKGGLGHGRSLVRYVSSSARA